jgi:hypothetical protein
MDDLRLQISMPEYPYAFDHGSQFLMMGSCFAEEMGTRMAALRFKTVINPNGILYAPLSIADVLRRAIEGEIYTREDLITREDITLSWQHHGSIYGMDQAAFLERINGRVRDLRASLESIDVLILTFGTAYHWVLKEEEQRVVNCHKQSSSKFEKVLYSTKQLAQDYTELIQDLMQINPKLRVVLTVSPVRYKRDGLIENNRSKARLLLLCELLEAQFESISYFPSYELLIDSLRDYRFYAKDRVHPSEEAVDYVWERFLDSCFTDPCKTLTQKIASYNRSTNHRPLYPESIAAKKFESNLKIKAKELQDLLKKYL